MNLGGAVQEIKRAKTNIELVEGINRFTEEFYKTLSILLYVRYRKKIVNDEIDPNDDIINLIQDYCEKPTFNSWMKLTSDCYTVFSNHPDSFAETMNILLNKKLQGELKEKSKNVIREIYTLKSCEPPSPKKITYGYFLGTIKDLRNFRSHHWDNNARLEPLVRSGIKEVVIYIIGDIFKDIDVKIIKPVNIERTHVNTYVFDYGTNTTSFEKIEEQIVPKDNLSSTYILFPDEDEIFVNLTNLIHLDENTNRVYVYQQMKNANSALFINVPIIGEINEIALDYDGQNKVFSLSKSEIEKDKLRLTLKQKYGVISQSGNLIHNIPSPFESYVSRPKKEEELIKRLKHPRTHIISLSGGGGYGKTELVKQVLWNVLKNQEVVEGFDLHYDLGVWISAKETKFDCGSIRQTTSSFVSLEDFLDCILYVTNNIRYIGFTETEKKKIIVDVLNQYESPLLILDNLETIQEKFSLYNYLDAILGEIKSDIKVIITSRVENYNFNQYMIPVGSMEDEEAHELIIDQLTQLGIAERYSSDDKISYIAKISAKSPLLIIFVVQLLKRGYTLEEFKKGEFGAYEQALNFICEFQWKELSEKAKNILMAVTVAHGKCSFAQVRQMCSITDTDSFQYAKEELSQRSFLIQSELENSMFALLPPIYLFVKSQFIKYPGKTDQMEKQWNILNQPESITSENSENPIYNSDDIQLQQLIQKADSFIRVNAISYAHEYYIKGVQFFPESPIAWRELAEFEFKFLEDDNKARSSFQKAIELDPTDPVTYTKFAYCEQNRGQNQQQPKYVKDSIEYNKKALSLFTDEKSQRIVKDHIGSAYLKLAEIEKNQGLKTRISEEKHNHFIMSDEYVKMAIKIFEDNIILKPKDEDEKYHNAIDYNYLAIAYIRRARPEKKNEEYYHQKALVCLVNGLKARPSDNKLLFTLGDHNIKRLLRDKYKIIVNDSDRIITQKKILAISDKIEDDFDRMKLK